MAVLTTSKKNKVLYVTLTRPEFHNALDEELIRSLTKVFSSVSAKSPRDLT